MGSIIDREGGIQPTNSRNHIFLEVHVAVAERKIFQSCTSHRTHIVKKLHCLFETYLSVLSAYILIPHFNLETNRSIRATTLYEMWRTSVNTADGNSIIQNAIAFYNSFSLCGTTIYFNIAPPFCLHSDSWIWSTVIIYNWCSYRVWNILVSAVFLWFGNVCIIYIYIYIVLKSY